MKIFHMNKKRTDMTNSYKPHRPKIEIMYH
jgi:hypothetical protein